MKEIHILCCKLLTQILLLLVCYLSRHPQLFTQIDVVPVSKMRMYSTVTVKTRWILLTHLQCFYFFRIFCSSWSDKRKVPLVETPTCLRTGSLFVKYQMGEEYPKFSRLDEVSHAKAIYSPYEFALLLIKTLGTNFCFTFHIRLMVLQDAILEDTLLGLLIIYDQHNRTSQLSLDCIWHWNTSICLDCFC